MLFRSTHSNRPGYGGLLVLLAGAFLLQSCFGAKSRLKVGETAEGEVVEAIGLAPDDPNDLIQTKRASLVDAQRTAVEKAVGVYVSGRTLVEKAIAIENNILSKSDGYVKKYDILKEWTEDGLYKTKIRALVEVKQIQNDLNALDLTLTSVLKRPRVAIVLVESVGRNVSKTGVAKAAMESAFQKKGFVTVESADVKSTDLVLEGTAAALPFQQEGLGGFVSYRATLHGRVKKPTSDEALLSFSKEASGLGGSPELAAFKALETIGSLAAEELSDEIAQSWVDTPSLIISVENVASFDQASELKKKISSQPGVDSLVLRFFDEGTAQFEAVLKNATANEIASSLSKSSTFPAKVLETSSQLIRLSVQ